jgi:rhamnulokinase
MSATHYLAVDLGGESGRVILGHLHGGRLELEEIHRFPNSGVSRKQGLCWDLGQLEREIFRGIEKAGQRGVAIAGISTDSWGVDYVLLDERNEPLAEPYCYRDPRTDSSVARFSAKVPFPEVYAETGIQLMQINTIFQFEAQQHDDPGSLSRAHHFLNIGDYFNARFSGVAAAERSLASTTQLYNPRAGAWSEKLIDALGLSPKLFPPIVPTGTVLGPVTESVAKIPGLAGAQVIASASHDTGAAVAAVPALSSRPWAYLSSGTWSLLGAELNAPIINETSREAGFTNEVGLDNTIRYLKNISGLWIVQECRRAWEAAGQPFTYDELTRLALEHGPAHAHISPNDPRFLSAGGMPEKIAAFCRETGQPVPVEPGACNRVVLESLALSYAYTLAWLEELTGVKIETLHLVGGGGRNKLLNQLTADAIGRPVVVGPVEATAIGNLLIQALALGHLESPAHLRRVVEASFPTRIFQPQAGFSREVRARFLELMRR